MRCLTKHRTIFTALLIALTVSACGGGSSTETDVLNEDSKNVQDGGSENLPDPVAGGEVFTSEKIQLNIINEYIPFTSDSLFWACTLDGETEPTYNWHIDTAMNGVDVNPLTYLKQADSTFSIGQLSDNSVSLDYNSGESLILQDLIIEASSVAKRMTATISTGRITCTERLLVDTDVPDNADAWARLHTEEIFCGAVDDNPSLPAYSLVLSPLNGEDGIASRQMRDNDNLDFSSVEHEIYALWSNDTLLSMLWTEEGDPNRAYVVDFDTIEFGDETTSSFMMTLDIRPALTSLATPRVENGEQYSCQIINV